jgi:hypothetical protein
MPDGILKVAPKDYILLCADGQMKNSYESKQGKMFVFKALKMVGKAGVINIGTGEKGADGYDIIKYGQDVYSSDIKGITNATLIPFSTNGKSYSRKIEGVSLEDKNYYESTATQLDNNK